MKKNLKYFGYEGYFWSLFDGLTSPFITPFALALGASRTVVGVIGGLPSLGALLGQIPGAEIAEKFKDRVRISVILGILGRLVWIPIILIPFMFRGNSIVLFLILLAVGWLLLSMRGPSWTSVMGDIVPVRIRGSFFGRRNMFIGFFGVLATLVGGFLLDKFALDVFLGFAILFVAALFFIVLSTYFASRIKVKNYADHDHKLRDFLDIKGNFKKFLTFSTFFNFSYMIASPFFVVYMLVNLRMDYVLYTVFTAISTIAWIFSQRHWGKLSDRFGDKPVALMCVVGAAFVPLLYLLITSETIIWLVPIQIFSGFVWAGVELATFNLLLDFTSAPKRAVQIADYNTITAIPLIIGPLIGGLISDNVILILSGIPLIFVISAILRFSSVFFIYRMKEPRSKIEYPIKSVIREAVQIHPVRGLVHEVRVVGYCARCLVKFRRPKGLF